MEISINSDKSINNTSFTPEDLPEKYYNLKSQFTNLTKLYDVAQQELHDTKRNNQFSQELKEHLTSEIEALQKNETKLRNECFQKCKLLQDEIDALKNEKWKETEQLNNNIETLQGEIAMLKLSKVTEKEEIMIAKLDDTRNDNLKLYEEEISTLKLNNAETKKDLTDTLTLNEVYKSEIESLKEQIECVRSNLECKKQEITAVTDLLHSAQDELCTVNGELQHLKVSAGNFAAKGNSLFAEVDDKRQEMLKSLSQMKEKVCHLNRELVSKQAEVDALLCEKKTLWEQYSGQSAHQDAMLCRAYEKRITELECQLNQLRGDIARWFDKNMDPQSSEAAQWLSGVLDHYRNENGHLSTELTAACVNNLTAQQRLRELQRQTVTWRTKAIEAKAVISELETKLQLIESAAIISNKENLRNDEIPKVLSSVESNANIVSDKVVKREPKEVDNDRLQEEVKKDVIKGNIKDYVSPVNGQSFVSNASEVKAAKKTISFK